MKFIKLFLHVLLISFFGYTIQASAPVANISSASGQQTTPISIILTATGNSTLTFSIQTQPTHGIISQQSVTGTLVAGTTTTYQATFTYTSHNNFAGQDTFLFKVTDNSSHTSTATGYIQVLPIGTTAYVCNTLSNTVSVITTATNQVIGSPITVGDYPYAIATSPDGSKAYVCNNTSPGTVSVITTANNTVTSSIPVGNNPTAIAISPDGSKAYVCNNVSGTVSVITTATNTVTSSIPVGNNPRAIAISPDGSKAYVCNYVSGTVSVINTADYSKSTIPVGDYPAAIAITPDGSKAYVCNHEDGTVSVIDTADYSKSSIPVGNNPTAIAISPDGSKAYVANSSDGTVSVITTATNQVSSIPVGAYPRAIAISPDGSEAYVCNDTSSGTVSVINTADYSKSSIPVGNSPTAIAITGYLQALGNSVQALQNNATSITLQAGSSNTADTLNYEITRFPQHGILSSTSGRMTTPNPYYHANINYTSLQSSTYLGQDSFDFTVTNSTGTKSTATVYIQIEYANKARLLTCNVGDGTISNINVGNPGTSPNKTLLSIGNLNTGDQTIAVSKSGLVAYVCNSNANSISVINTITNELITSIPVGNNPNSIAISPDGSKAYVCNYGYDQTQTGTVSVITTATNQVVATITVGIEPTAIAFTPDGSKAYVCNYNNFTSSTPIITAINTSNYSTTNITVESKPYAIAITPNGLTAYVCNYGSNTVSVINTQTNQVITTITVGNNPIKIAITPDGSKAYVANSSDGTVSVITTANNQVVATITVDIEPASIAITPDGSKAYVCNLFSGTASVITTSNNRVVATIPVGSFPYAITISTDGSTAYVSNYGSNTVSVITTSNNNSTTGSINVGSHPTAIALCGFASATFSNTVQCLKNNPVPILGLTDSTTTPTPITLKAYSGDGSPVYFTVTSDGDNFSGLSITFPNGHRITDRNQSYTYLGTLSAGTNLYTLTLSCMPNSNPNIIDTFTYTINYNLNAGAGTIQVPIIPQNITNAYICNNTTSGTVTSINATSTTSFTAGTNPIGIMLSNNSSAAGIASYKTLKIFNTYNNYLDSYYSLPGNPTAIYALYISFFGNIPIMCNFSDKSFTTLFLSQLQTITFDNADGNEPIALAWDPFNQRGYVCNYGIKDSDTPGSIVSVITISSVLKNIKVGRGPCAIAITPDGLTAYVCNIFDGTVSVINTQMNQVIATIPVSISPNALAITPDGLQVYVCDVVSPYLCVINTQTHATSTIPIESPQAAVISLDGSTAYIASSSSGNIFAINTQTNTIKQSFPSGIQNPNALAITPDGSYLYVYEKNAGTTMSIISTADFSITTIENLQNPSGLALFATLQADALLYTALAGATLNISVSGSDPLSNSISFNVPQTTNGNILLNLTSSSAFSKKYSYAVPEDSSSDWFSYTANNTGNKISIPAKVQITITSTSKQNISNPSRAAAYIQANTKYSTLKS